MIYYPFYTFLNLVYICVHIYSWKIMVCSLLFFSCDGCLSTFYLYFCFCFEYVSMCVYVCLCVCEREREIGGAFLHYIWRLERVLPYQSPFCSFWDKPFPINLELRFFSWLAVSKPYRSSLLPSVLRLLSCMGVALLVGAANVLLSSPTASLFKRLFSHHYSNQILTLVCSQDFTVVSFSFRVHLLGSAPKSSNIICLTFLLKHYF